MNTLYDKRFFARNDRSSLPSAAIIAPIVYEWLQPASVLDVGGGSGGWTAAFAAAGVRDYLCVDGDYVDQATLRIPADRFRVADLSRPLDLGRRFDLAVCLEVAEHLPQSCAGDLMMSLARHADAVLFSAAIPLQSGTHHVNCQWPAYWAEQFASKGYSCFDCLRFKVWNEPRVAPWYKQNALLYLNSSGLEKLPKDSPIHASRVSAPLAVVHPEIHYLELEASEVARLPKAMRRVAKSARASFRYHTRRIFQSRG
jgi:SAM-dependent methyltransferase